MTFAEFEQLPSNPAGRQELRSGELCNVPPPKWDHYLCQRNLRRLLSEAAGNKGLVDTEMGFRAKAEHEYRVADVAFLSRVRAESVQGYLLGAPELVIEVLSPSNTAAEMLDKKTLCLQNGSLEFWVVSLEHRQVEVSTPDGRSVTYTSGQQIPLFFGASIAVDEIF